MDCGGGEGLRRREGRGRGRGWKEREGGRKEKEREGEEGEKDQVTLPYTVDQFGAYQAIRYTNADFAGCQIWEEGEYTLSCTMKDTHTR